MELLKFIAEEFLHIESKAFFFLLPLVLDFCECRSAPEMERPWLPLKLTGGKVCLTASPALRRQRPALSCGSDSRARMEILYPCVFKQEALRHPLYQPAPSAGRGTTAATAGTFQVRTSTH